MHLHRCSAMAPALHVGRWGVETLYPHQLRRRSGWRLAWLAALANFGLTWRGCSVNFSHWTTLAGAVAGRRNAAASESLCSSFWVVVQSRVRFRWLKRHLSTVGYLRVSRQGLVGEKFDATILWVVKLELIFTRLSARWRVRVVYEITRQSTSQTTNDEVNCSLILLFEQSDFIIG